MLGGNPKPLSGKGKAIDESLDAFINTLKKVLREY
jgi:hypothetical protein